MLDGGFSSRLELIKYRTIPEKSAHWAINCQPKKINSSKPGKSSHSIL